MLALVLSACGAGTTGGENDRSDTPGAIDTAAASTAGASGQGGGNETVPGSPAGRGDGGDGGTVDVCELLTAEEVEAAVGVEPTTVEGDETGGCVYSGADGSLLVLTSYTPTGASAIDALADGDDAEDAPGFGDRAVWSSDILFIGRGDALFQIFADENGPASGDDRAATEELARLALDRLP